jgi:hypothetical protein
MKRPKRLVKRYTTPMPKSSMRYILESFVPYTEANLKLTFMPNAFFNELEKLDRAKERYRRQTLRNTYYKAKAIGYISIDNDGLARLTDAGQQALNPYIPELIDNSCVMVIFDIPETYGWKRRYLRALLRELKFTQIQKSVWASQLNCIDILKDEITKNSLHSDVQIYEAARLL